MDKMKGPKNYPEIREEIGQKLLDSLDNIYFWYQEEWSEQCKLREETARSEIKRRIQKWMSKKGR